MLIRSGQPKCMLQREEPSFSTPFVCWLQQGSLYGRPFFNFNGTTPLLVVIKSKDYAALAASQGQGIVAVEEGIPQRLTSAWATLGGTHLSQPFIGLVGKTSQ
jgi:hypothetical protein